MPGRDWMQASRRANTPWAGRERQGQGLVCLDVSVPPPTRRISRRANAPHLRIMVVSDSPREASPLSTPATRNGDGATPPSEPSSATCNENKGVAGPGCESQHVVR